MKAIAAATLLALTSAAVPALAGRVPDNLVSGTVSAVSGTQIVIDGKSYSIKVDTPAFRDLQHLTIGQSVDVVLNGPPQSAASQVVVIHVHEAGQ